MAFSSGQSFAVFVYYSILSSTYLLLKSKLLIFVSATLVNTLCYFKDIRRTPTSLAYNLHLKYQTIHYGYTLSNRGDVEHP